MLKANDAYIKFAFLTGISKFSKANIFSGLNNLEDISLVPKYGNICGYTQDELEGNFQEYLVDIDLKKVKQWYNGYNFLGDKVYNPFDVLQYLKNRTFDNYWWESGNPYFLIQLLKQGNYFIPESQNIKTDKTILNTFEIEKLRLEVLLFQSGYLTIDKVEINFDDTTSYRLKIPNKEVQISLNQLFIDYLTNSIRSDIRGDLHSALVDSNFEFFKTTLISLFASIPYNNYVKNNITHFEGYYASVIYTYLASLGIEIVAEDVTNRGRIDLTIKLNENIYILEFKVLKEKSQEKNSALKQLKEKLYHQKYISDDSNIYLIGIEFSESEKNISSFEWEVITR
jgi:hypothetical protein